VNVPFDIGLVPGLSINARHRDERIRNGVSIALLWNHAARVDGLTAALGVTVVEERSSGIAMGFIGNINRGTHAGAQIAYLFNSAKTVHGAQIATVNKSGDVAGVQFGLINVGGNVSGAQIGLINIARRADVSIGLIPITKEGGVRFEVWTSDTALINLGLRLPARFTYVFVSGGLHPIAHSGASESQSRGRGWEFGGGFGGHIPIGSGFIDIDLGAYGVVSGLQSPHVLAPMARARLLGGMQIAKRCAFFLGPTFNILFDDPHRPIDRPGYGWVTRSRQDADVRARSWPGFAAGLRF